MRRDRQVRGVVPRTLQLSRVGQEDVSFSRQILTVLGAMLAAAAVLGLVGSALAWGVLHVTGLDGSGPHAQPTLYMPPLTRQQPSQDQAGHTPGGSGNTGQAAAGAAAPPQRRVQ